MRECCVIRLQCLATCRAQRDRTVTAMKISSAGWKGKRNVLKQLCLFFFSLVLPKLDVPWSQLMIFEFLTSNCWLFLTALEALQSFEAVVGFYSRTVFNNDFQIFILFYFCQTYAWKGQCFFLFICIFHWIAINSVLAEDYCLPGCHTHFQIQVYV